MLLQAAVLTIEAHFLSNEVNEVLAIAFILVISFQHFTLLCFLQHQVGFSLHEKNIGIAPRIRNEPLLHEF
jgi:hypothetical protein